MSIRGNTIWGSQGLAFSGSTTGDGIRVHGIVVRGDSRFGADPAGNNSTVVFRLENNIGLRSKDTGIGVSVGLGSGSVVEGTVASNKARENGLDSLRISNGKGGDNLQNGISALGNTDGGGNIAVGNGDSNTPGFF